MHNAYGLADSARYNYFAHIREILYGDNTKITSAKRITLSDYVKAHLAIRNYHVSLHNRIETARRNSRVGTGERGILDQIAIEKLYLEYNAMREALSKHEHLMYLFQKAPSNTLTFAKLIDGAYTYTDSYTYRLMGKKDADVLKKTLMEEPLKLWHSRFA